MLHEMYFVFFCFLICVCCTHQFLSVMCADIAELIAGHSSDVSKSTRTLLLPIAMSMSFILIFGENASLKCCKTCLTYLSLVYCFHKVCPHNYNLYIDFSFKVATFCLGSRQFCAMSVNVNAKIFLNHSNVLILSYLV